jgi:predicted nuclease of predicted toxin-antitoxin system
MSAFKVDENLPNEVADRLAQLGYDVATVFDEGLNGHPDSDVADACKAERRALLTLDRDFGNILAYPPDQYSGIIILSPLRTDKPRVLSLFERLIPLLATEPVDGKLWIVEETQIRIR